MKLYKEQDVVYRQNIRYFLISDNIVAYAKTCNRDLNALIHKSGLFIKFIPLRYPRVADYPNNIMDLK